MYHSLLPCNVLSTAESLYRYTIVIMGNDLVSCGGFVSLNDVQPLTTHWMKVCVCVCMHVCMHVCVRGWVCVCVCVLYVCVLVLVSQMSCLRSENVKTEYPVKVKTVVGH